MHVTRIESTLNSPDGRPWAFDLTRLVLIVGRNGSHKSSIPLALQLALSDQVDDWNGKESCKDEGELISMAPADGELWASATLDDASVSRWGTRKEGNTTKQRLFEPSDSVDPLSVFPLRAVRDVLSGGKDKARAQFLQWVGASVQEADVLAEIPAHLHARYRDVAEAKRKAANAPDGASSMLVAIGEYVAKRCRQGFIDGKSNGALIFGVRVNHNN